MSVHPRAIVGEKVELGEGVEVGPNAIIEGEVRIGAGSRIYPNAYISGWVDIGENCQVHPGAVLGHLPQDFHFEPGTRTYLKIGDGTIIREMATIHAGTQPESSTVIGKNCFILCNAHIGHNCIIGDEAKIYTFVGVSGHVEIGPRAIVSGVSALHQFIRIGEEALIGGLTRVPMDVPPYFICQHDHGCTGINIIGMQRTGHSREAILACKNAFKLLYRSNKPFRRAVAELAETASCDEVRLIAEFCQNPSRRGIIGGRSRAGASLKRG